MPEITTEPLRIAVIGGGITGLAACFYLQRQSQDESTPVDITLFEAGDRFGGVFGTVPRDGYLVETGADMFITNKPGGIKLVRELGLESRLIETQPQYRRSLILRRGLPLPTPSGFDLMVPRTPWTLLKSPLLSLAGKVRVLAEYFLPGRPQEDETLASFAKRRFGREAFERIIQPMVGGIYTADPERLSLRATLPRFLDMEACHGSLIRAVLHERRQASQHRDSRLEDASGARYGLFLSFDQGMSVMQDALIEAIESRCQLRRNTSVASLTCTAGQGYLLRDSQGNSLGEFAGVLVALPAPRATSLLAPLAPELAAELASIEYASAAIVVTGHSLRNIRHPMDAYGLVIPAVENRRILAVSCTSRKFPGRAPEGAIQLRTFIGGALQQHLLKESDEALIAIALEELQDIFGVTGTPDFCQVVRWNRAMPQYHLGHVERVRHIRELASLQPGLELAGNAYEGVGIPDVIESAELASQRLLRKMNNAPPAA